MRTEKIENTEKAREELTALFERIQERYNDVIPDLRVDPPLEPQFLFLAARVATLESLRENIGLIKFQMNALLAAYRDTLTALKEADEGRRVDWGKVVRSYLLNMEGVMHLLLTLSRELDAIWRALRAHHMWEVVEEERKKLRAERMREARRRKKGDIQTTSAAQPSACGPGSR